MLQRVEAGMFVCLMRLGVRRSDFLSEFQKILLLPLFSDLFANEEGQNKNEMDSRAFDSHFEIPFGTGVVHDRGAQIDLKVLWFTYASLFVSFLG